MVTVSRVKNQVELNIDHLEAYEEDVIGTMHALLYELEMNHNLSGEKAERILTEIQDCEDILAQIKSLVRVEN